LSVEVEAIFKEVAKGQQSISEKVMAVVKAGKLAED
jgi:hypothetical protein